MNRASSPRLLRICVALCAAAFAAWIVLELVAAFWFPRSAPAATLEDVLELKARVGK